MKTAVYSAQPLAISPVAGAEVYSLDQLEQANLQDWNAIIIIGSAQMDIDTNLSPVTLERLWRFVEGGGLVYGELIDAYDFTSSRLFGWKQDFPKSNRTVEKLRVSQPLNGLGRGELLEWSGAFALGFPIEAEGVLEFGQFRDTHVSMDGEIVSYPGLHIRKLGAGTVVYASFSLFSNSKPETLRPHFRWNKVIETLSSKTGILFDIWPKAITIRNDNLPEQAVERSLRWFHQSGIMPAADGSKGVCENVHSLTTRLTLDRRPDCHAHTSLMLFLYGKWSNNHSYIEASHQLLQYLFDNNYQDLEPDSPSYGLFKWYDYPGAYPDQMFTDDNSWVCFVLMYLYRQTNNEAYLKHALPLAEALLATQREDGLRSEVLRRSQLVDSGSVGAKQLPASMNPHFESITHAAFIQAYLVTGREDYLDVAMKGSKQMLANMDKLSFMYSRTSGLSRFLLPLGFLSRYDDSGAIDSGIEQIVDYLLACQSPLGGIEEMDNPDPERFGKEDAGVFIHNGEGIADQLYTNNFLLMNVWEIWKAKDDAKYRILYDTLSDYMCRIQMSSHEARYDGGWMRAFDLRHGEYFGNNGDTGWGPYCIESGWTNAMTTSGLLLMLLDESIFD